MVISVLQSRTLFWVGLYALICLVWGALALTTPSFDGGALFGALEPQFSGAAHGDLGLDRLSLMWALMSLGMMLPTAVPMIRTHLDLSHARPNRALLRLGFVGGYALIWLAFALLAAFAQQWLYQMGWVDAAGVSFRSVLTFALLLLAGAYQFSPLKQACVRECRSPMAFFMTQWRDGVSGALLMGLRHGAACLGCCWALMLLGFVGGTMNLAWMGLAMILMALEKLPHIGARVSTALGLVLLALAFAYAVAWGLNA